MNKLWIYRIAVILLAGGLAVALFVKKSEPASDVETETLVSGWRNIEPSEVEDNFVKLLHENMGLLTVGEPGQTNSMTIGW